MTSLRTERAISTQALEQGAKHTPGPWEVAGDFLDWWIRSKAVRQNICDRLLSDNEHDYYLIAAAPDMLQLLIDLRDYGRNGKWTRSNGVDNELSAVIAKALGERPSTEGKSGLPERS